MPLQFEATEDPHPEVTAFAKEVIRVGQKYQQNNEWCETWKGAVREMGLDPDAVEDGKTTIEVAVMVPVTVQMKVALEEFKDMTPAQQNNALSKLLARSMAQPRNQAVSNQIGLYQEGSNGTPNTGRYHDWNRFSGVLGNPIVVDANVRQMDGSLHYMGLRFAAADSLTYFREHLSVAYRLESGSPEDTVRHIIPNVRQENVHVAAYVSCCDERGPLRRWQGVPEQDFEDHVWCTQCIALCARRYVGGFEIGLPDEKVQESIARVVEAATKRDDVLTKVRKSVARYANA